MQAALSLHRILGRYRSIAGFGEGFAARQFTGSQEFDALANRLFDAPSDPAGVLPASADHKSGSAGDAKQPAAQYTAIKPWLVMPPDFIRAKVDKYATAL